MSVSDQKHTFYVDPPNQSYVGMGSMPSNNSLSIALMRLAGMLHGIYRIRHRCDTILTPISPALVPMV